MAKRFIDTGLFEDAWFMNLSVGGKLLWIYLITKCNHAGIIEINQKLIEFQTKIKSLETVIKELGNRLVTVSEQPLIFFIPKFIYFQYPKFPQSNVKQQISAIEILKKYNLYDEEELTLNKELVNSYVNGSGTVNGIEHKPVSNKSKKVIKEFIKPTIEEVITFFVENGYTKSHAINVYHYYNDANWKDSKGNQVLAWKQKMRGVWFKEENKINKPSSSLVR